MASRRNRILITAMAAILAGLVVSGALLHERLLDTLHAWRTGYRFEWMPEGVVPVGPRAINHAGQVAVNAYEGESDTSAALWSSEEARVRLTGAVPGRPPHSNAIAIGDDGSIVGAFWERTGGSWNRLQGGFIWSERGGIVEISNPGGGTCWAMDVNRNGQVAGVLYNSEGRVDVIRERAASGFRWARDSGIELLDPLPGTSEVYVTGINDDGWVIGGARSRQQRSRPAVWIGKTPREIGLPPGYSRGSARAINSRGEVLIACLTGEPRRHEVEHAFIWSEDSGYVALPIPGGCMSLEAVGLNDAGQVLLAAIRASDGARTAFLLTGGESKLLPPARFGLSTVYLGLNDRGWLTGYVELEASGPDARDRGFVARP